MAGVPFATISSPAAAVVLGFVVNVALAFCMGTADLNGIVNNEIGQPLATILFNSFGKRGTLAVWSITILVQFFMGVTGLTAGARLTWAFSRDGALPLSRYLSRLNPITKTPLYAALYTASISLAVGFLVFAGPVATSALFSSTLVGQYISLTIVFLARFFGGEPWVSGPFSLGKFCKPIGFTSILFMILVMVILIFPSNPNPSASTMNYTVLVIGGWIGMCLCYYYLPVYGGVHWFRGPVANITPADETSDMASLRKSSVEEDRMKY
ncbi:hypothetical protein EUX98_g1788 [Antrodiella citrinella]|uniref:Amino acid permease/ SLC12A domain-containing protein n=1 Tax=Antrodiella citrinella TaxID=2447956 RepID=A0A4S4N0K1_9APHY|nr:hypothetical protein EUX98_g1788 [Antrodiella citrinella]